MWNSDYIITIISFLGLFVGLLIGLMTREELKDGRKYLLTLQKALFLLVVFFVINGSGYLVASLLSVVVLSFILFRIEKNFDKIMYFFCAIALFFSEGVTVPALVFFYGLPTGSLFLLESKKKGFGLIRSLFCKYYYFLIVVLVLFLLKLIL